MTPVVAVAKKNPDVVKVNKWDASAVKNALDDAVRKFVVAKYDYTERTLLSDLRIAISLIACSFAGLALVWDYLNPFPKSRNVLILCVLSYFALMGVLQMFMWFVEKTTFFVAFDRDPTGQKEDLTFKFNSRLKKYDDKYLLEILVNGSKSYRSEGKFEKSIASWFDVNGVLVQANFARDVFALHDSLLPSRKGQ